MSTIADTIERIERGIAAYRSSRRRRMNRTRSTPQQPTVGGKNYEASDVPQQARRLWRNRPDLQADFTTVSARDHGYHGRSGDLAELIADAATGDLPELDGPAIVDLESGEYEMQSKVWTGGDEPNTYQINDGEHPIVGVVGDGSGDATIHYVGTHLDSLFVIDTLDTGVFGGFTVDIREPAPEGHDSDVGILKGRFRERFWADDVRLRGKRNRFQDIGRDVPEEGVKEPIGGLFNWWVQLTKEHAEGLVHDLRFPHGEVDHPDVADQIEAKDEMPEKASNCDGEYCRLHVADNGVKYSKFGGSIPVSTDEPHDGTIVYKNCYVEGFTDNGFYMSYTPKAEETGQAILWDCEAANVRGGAMRLGENDTIVGGVSRMTDAPGDRNGKALDVDKGEHVDVIGLHLVGTDYGGEAIQVRTMARELTLDRVTLRTDNDPQRPVRLSADPDDEPPVDVTIENCHWYDAYADRSKPIVEIYNAEVTASNWHVFAAADDEVLLHSSATLEVDGDPKDPGTYTAGELGMDDPRERVDAASQNV